MGPRGGRHHGVEFEDGRIDDEVTNEAIARRIQRVRRQ
jgi:hypothetical protein